MNEIFPSLVALATFVSVARAQPAVDLLIDHGFPSTGTLNLNTVLAAVTAKKGTFHFGSTYDTFNADQSWFDSVFSTFYRHVVAENGCKWDAPEPSQGVKSLTECLGAQSFATHLGFRVVVGTIIPQHVQAEIQGMGASVTSRDVVNEVVGDGVSAGMTSLQCVQNKCDWPLVTSDGSGVPLVTDLSFIFAAFKTAFQFAGANTRLAVNEYNTGGAEAKTACIINLIKRIQANTTIPFNRLVSSLAIPLGVSAMITEMDIEVNADTTPNLRYQAAIWGDYLDVCLYASNCFEFINWDPRDDLSWRGSAAAATLFDTNGNPKPAAYEVAARLQNFANGGAEPCATATGTGVCTITITGTMTVGRTAVGTTKTTTTTTSSAPTQPTGPTNCASAEWGQCGGIGWAGCLGCPSGTTCQVLND
ncbi:glycoside hydrolase superfamily [Mycena alexandri]|uniref:Glycoside hydrolase superfamily n=1 Tax=Mycena alexandri TaxID=1745969 RepID=A0AAD6RW79_9AGAR|nr:glycoside hydrolase superfamily [Mycena alexandri]